MDCLLELLEQHGGDDVVISYEDLANYFPTNESHEDTFAYKRLDQPALFDWANENGWIVEPLPEEAPTSAPNSPPVRFRK